MIEVIDNVHHDCVYEVKYRIDLDLRIKNLQMYADMLSNHDQTSGHVLFDVPDDNLHEKQISKALLNERELYTYEATHVIHLSGWLESPAQERRFVLGGLRHMWETAGGRFTIKGIDLKKIKRRETA